MPTWCQGRLPRASRSRHRDRSDHGVAGLLAATGATCDRPMAVPCLRGKRPAGLQKRSAAAGIKMSTGCRGPSRPMRSGRRCLQGTACQAPGLLAGPGAAAVAAAASLAISGSDLRSTTMPAATSRAGWRGVETNVAVFEVGGDGGVGEEESTRASCELHSLAAPPGPASRWLLRLGPLPAAAGNEPVRIEFERQALPSWRLRQGPISASPDDCICTRTEARIPS